MARVGASPTRLRAARDAARGASKDPFSKIVNIVGAPPNFVKIGPIMQAYESADIEAFRVHTGQHYDAAMSELFFEQLGIPKPNVNLGIGGASHAIQTAVLRRCARQRRCPRSQG